MREKKTQTRLDGPLSMSYEEEEEGRGKKKER